MKAQEPALGVLKRDDWGDSKSYQIVCGCGHSSHDHNVWIEADLTGVSVQIFTEQTSDYWTNGWGRFKLIWQLLTTGYVKQESTIYMSKQQALNYAEILKSAVKDVESFHNARQNKAESAKVNKEANNQDCV